MVIPQFVITLLMSDNPMPGCMVFFGERSPLLSVLESNNSVQRFPTPTLSVSCHVMFALLDAFTGPRMLYPADSMTVKEAFESAAAFAIAMALLAADVSSYVVPAMIEFIICKFAPVAICSCTFFDVLLLLAMVLPITYRALLYVPLPLT